MGTADRHVDRLAETATLPIPQLASDFPTTGYIIPSFTNTLVGVGTICDEECIVLFAKNDVTVFSTGGKPILTGWRKNEMPKLWRFALRPNKELLLHQTTESKKTTLSAYSAYNLPIVEALLRCMHAASGFPVKSMWLRAIKRGNLRRGQALHTQISPSISQKKVETMKGHMVQSSQVLLSTKNKKPPPISTKNGLFKVAPEEEEMDDIPTLIKTKELHI